MLTKKLKVVTIITTLIIILLALPFEPLIATALPSNSNEISTTYNVNYYFKTSKAYSSYTSLTYDSFTLFSAPTLYDYSGTALTDKSWSFTTTTYISDLDGDLYLYPTNYHFTEWKLYYTGDTGYPYVYKPKNWNYSDDPHFHTPKSDDDTDTTTWLLLSCDTLYDGFASNTWVSQDITFPYGYGGVYTAKAKIHVAADGYPANSDPNSNKLTVYINDVEQDSEGYDPDGNYLDYGVRTFSLDESYFYAGNTVTLKLHGHSARALSGNVYLYVDYVYLFFSNVEFYPSKISLKFNGKTVSDGSNYGEGSVDLSGSVPSGGSYTVTMSYTLPSGSIELDVNYYNFDFSGTAFLTSDLLSSPVTFIYDGSNVYAVFWICTPSKASDLYIKVPNSEWDTSTAWIKAEGETTWTQVTPTVVNNDLKISSSDLSSTATRYQIKIKVKNPFTQNTWQINSLHAQDKYVNSTAKIDVDLTFDTTITGTIYLLVTPNGSNTVVTGKETAINSKTTYKATETIDLSTKSEGWYDIHLWTITNNLRAGYTLKAKAIYLDKTPPTITWTVTADGTTLSNKTGSFGESKQLTITVEIYDNTLDPQKVDPPAPYTDVKAYIKDDQGVLNDWTTMSYVSYDSANHKVKFTYTYNGLSFQPETTITIYVKAVDPSGNIKIETYQLYVLDDVPPTIDASTLQYPTTIEYDENIIVKVKITDDNQVDTPLIYYRINNNPWVHKVGTEIDSVNHIYQFVIDEEEFSYGDIVYFYLWVNDTRNNVDQLGSESSPYQVNVIDNTLPSLVDVWSSSATIEYDDNLIIYVNVTDYAPDGSGISSVTITYTIGTETYTATSTSYSQRTVGADNYYYEIHTFTISADLYKYGDQITITKIEIVDKAGNTATYDNTNSAKLPLTVNVVDNTSPTIGTPNYNTPEYDENLTVNITLTEPSDASGVASATLKYRVNGGTWQQTSMTLVSGDGFNGVWEATISETLYKYGDIVEFYIVAEDVAGNTATSTIYSVTIQDNTPPQISSWDYEPKTPEYDEDVAFWVVPTDIDSDASGISQVKIVWSKDLSTWYILELYDPDKNGNYTNILSEENLAYDDIIYFYIEVIDQAGNKVTDNNNGAYYSFRVDDFTPPTIWEITQTPLADSVEYTDDVKIYINASEPSDASGISQVTVKYGTDPSNLDNSVTATWDSIEKLYIATIPKQPYNTTIYYKIYVLDSRKNAYGTSDPNMATSTLHSYTVKDFTPPTINSVTISPTQPTYLDQVTVKADVSDDKLNGGSGVSKVYLLYSTDQIMWTTIEMTYDVVNGYIATIPKQPYNTTIYYKINATDVAGNIKISTIYSYTVGDSKAPTLESYQLEPSTPVYYENTTVTTYLYDEEDIGGSGVASATLYYSYKTPEMTSYSIWYQTVMAYNSTLDAWIAEIPKYPYATQVRFYIVAEDVAGNTATLNNLGQYYTYTITDDVPPLIWKLTATPENPEYYETITIIVGLYEPSEASGIDLNNIYLLVSVNGGTENQYLMNLETGDKVNATFKYIIGPYPYGTSLTIRVKAYDNVGNYIFSSYLNLYVNDTVPPEISYFAPTDISEVPYNETVTVIVNTSEPSGASGIQSVELHYIVNAQEYTLQMVKVGTTTYSKDLPQFSYGTQVEYWIIVSDEAGNTAATQHVTYIVTDPYPPEIRSIDRDPITPTYEDNVTIYADVYEPSLASGVNTVILYYRNSSSSPWVITVMTYDSESSKYVAIIPKHPYKTVIEYYVFANDTAGNSINSQILNYTVSDLGAPQILNFTTNPEDLSNINYTQTVTVTVIVTDDVGLSYVKIILTIGGETNSYAMQQVNETTYTYVIGKQPWNTYVEFYVEACDVDGNIAQTSTKSYTVQDSKPPSLGTPSYTEYPEYDENNIIKIAVDDEKALGGSGVAQVTLYYRRTGETFYTTLTMTYDSIENIYKGTINSVELYFNDTFEFYIVATDNAGNAANTTIFIFHVVDRTAPNIDTATLSQNPITVEYYQDVTISVAVSEPTDASGIKTITLIYSIGGQTKQIEMIYDSQIGKYVATIPQQPYGSTVQYWIKAEDNVGNYAETSKYSYEVYDFQPPTHESPQISPETPEYDDNVTVTIIASEPEGASGIQYVKLHYMAGDSGTWITVEMVYQGSDMYSAKIPSQKYGTTVKFYIEIADNAYNIIYVNKTSPISYIVQDFTSPEVEMNLPSIVGYKDDFLVNFTVTEPNEASGVDVVILYYRINDGAWFNVTLTSENGIYTYTISKDLYNFNDTIQLYVFSSDIAKNNITTEIYTLLVGDAYPPIFYGASINPTEPEYYENATVIVDVRDDEGGSGLKQILIQYSLDNAVWHNLTVEVQGQYYVATIPPQPWNTTVFVKITAEDKSGNINIKTLSYTVTDTVPPVLISYKLPENITYENDVTIEVNFTDEGSGSSTIKIMYRVDFGEWIEIEGYFDTSAQIYKATIPAQKYGSQVDFKIYLYDKAGVVTISPSSGTYSYKVKDFTPPEITGLDYPEEVNHKEAISINVTAQEPSKASGVSKVYVYYTLDNTTWVKVEMLKQGFSYMANLPQQPWNTTLYFYIVAEDVAGNTATLDNNGKLFEVKIVDNTPPKLSGYEIPNKATYEEEIKVSITVDDEVGGSGISSVKLIYSIDGATWIEITMEKQSGTNIKATYKATISGQPYGTTVYLYFEVTDIAGNKATYNNLNEYFKINIVDDVPPEMENYVILPVNPVYYNDTTIILFVSDEASGVKEAVLRYRVEGGFTEKEVIMEYNEKIGGYVATIPQTEYRYGSLIEFYFMVTDNDGNAALLNNNNLYYTLTIGDDTPPQIQSIQYQPDTPESNKPIKIYVVIANESRGAKVTRVYVTYQVIAGNETSGWKEAELKFKDNIWQTQITVKGDYVRFYIVAEDEAGNKQTSDLITLKLAPPSPMFSRAVQLTLTVSLFGALGSIGAAKWLMSGKEMLPQTLGAGVVLIRGSEGVQLAPAGDIQQLRKIVSAPIQETPVKGVLFTDMDGETITTLDMGCGKEVMNLTSSLLKSLPFNSGQEVVRKVGKAYIYIVDGQLTRASAIATEENPEIINMLRKRVKVMDETMSKIMEARSKIEGTFKTHPIIEQLFGGEETEGVIVKRIPENLVKLLEQRKIRKIESVHEKIKALSEKYRTQFFP